MESLNSFISDDANSMSSRMLPSIWINDDKEEEDGSSLEDVLRALHHQDVPVEVTKERRNRVDEIADKIIDAFTIKTEDRFIDTDEGILSNEDSEKRLIIIGSVLGIMLNVTLSALLVLASIVFSDKFEVATFNPSLDKSNTYPTPYLLIMAKLGLGNIVILRQNKALNFEIDLEFKVPPNKVLKTLSNFNPMAYALPPPTDPTKIDHWTQSTWNHNGRTTETGFSLFEDQGDLFIVYSDISKRVIVLNPSNKHKTLIDSQLPANHFYSNSIVRTGNFVWIFGGHSIPIADSINSWTSFINHGCSSIEYGAEEFTFTGSAMWHMEKQVWFEGPSLPIKTCSIEATAISLNKTDVLIFIGPFINSYLKHVEGEEWINDNGGCIQLLHFSYNTFSWVSQHYCFIDFGPRNYSFTPYRFGQYPFSNILSLASTSVFNKDGKL